MKQNSQNARLLEYLMTHDGITSLEASRLDRPIMRLSQRIIELEAIGYRFDRIDEKTDTAKFVRYKLKAAPQIVSGQNTHSERGFVVAAPCTAAQYSGIRG
jgi:hypothetical protein